MAAWRGRRGMTRATGAVAFFVSIGTAFTGFLVGAWFDVANLGQMLLLHVTLLPLVLGALVVRHVLLVRRHEVVPPLPAGHAAREHDGGSR